MYIYTVFRFFYYDYHHRVGAATALWTHTRNYKGFEESILCTGLIGAERLAVVEI